MRNVETDKKRRNRMKLEDLMKEVEMRGDKKRRNKIKRRFEEIRR